jgi:hypothetical protein
LLAWAFSALGELDGYLLIKGVDLYNLPFKRALRVLLSARVTNLDEKARSKLSAEWDRPLPSETRKRAKAKPSLADFFDAPNDGAVFKAAMKQTGGTIGS